MFSECRGVIMFACGVGVFTYPVVSFSSRLSDVCLLA